MIKIITEQEFKALLDTWEAAKNSKVDASELIGEYIVPGCDGFTAVDNSGGECFVEEFPSMCEAMGWLKDKDRPAPTSAEEGSDGSGTSVDDVYFDLFLRFVDMKLRSRSSSRYEIGRAHKLLQWSRSIIRKGLESGVTDFGEMRAFVLGWCAARE